MTLWPAKSILIETGFQLHYQEVRAILSTEVPKLWLTRLQENGYKLTGARRAVVEAVATSVYLLNPAEIFQHAARVYPRLGLVSVYRTLEKLEDLGLIQRVHMDDGCHSYVPAPSGHQHLLICTGCHRAEYFSGDDLAPLLERLRGEFGYKIQTHWLQLFGLCRQCQDKRNQEAHDYET